MMQAALLALALAVPQPQGEPPAQPAGTLLTTYKLAGRDIEARIPSPQSAALPGVSTVSWEGWSYLFGDKGNLMGRVKATGGWDDVKSLFEESKSKIAATTPQWRVKAYLFTRYDVLDQSADGVLRQRRATLEPSQVTRALEAMARFAAVATALGGGAYQVTIDAEIETDLLHFGPSRGKPVFDAAFADWYFGPRVNGGQFDSDDKVYRGPFDSVLYIHPGVAGDGQGTSLVNGTPVTGVAYEPLEEGGPARDISEQLLVAWGDQVTEAARRWGLPWPSVLPASGPSGSPARLSFDNWLLGTLAARVSNRSLPSADAYLAQIALAHKPASATWADVAADPWSKLPLLDLADLAKLAGKGSLVDVGEAGKSHSFAWEPGQPAGAVALDATILSGSESIAILPYGERQLVFVLGGVAPLVGSHLAAALDAKTVGFVVSQGDPLVVFDTKLAPQAKTEADLLDLSKDAPATHPAGPASCPPLAWSFAQALPPLFDLSTPTDPTSVEGRLAAAAKLGADSTEAQRSAVALMLNDREDSVRLNAAAAFARAKEPGAEASLIALTNEYNTRVVEEALRALAFQDTATAWAAIRRVMNNARYDYSRHIAAMLMGTRDEPNLPAAISIMLTARSWQARLAAAEAISRQKDLTSQRILMTFFNDVDPAVRLAVVRATATQLDPIAHALLWPAVNDPSDRVRAWSYLGLIGSTKDETRKEGYKGVRDDSIGVRILVLRGLAARPSEAHRAAIALGATDGNPLVRREALLAMAKQPGEVKTQDLGALLSEKDPRVQLGLVALAKAKGLKLPADLLAALRSSPDPEVAAGARELPD